MKKALTALVALMLILPLTAFAINAEDFVVSDVVDDTDKYYFYARLLMQDMSLEEKIAQMFIISPQQLAQDAFATEVNEQMAASVRDCAVGGVMLQGENIISGQQLKALSADLQHAADKGNHIPLFIAAEEEGGYVERIALKLGLAGTPSLRELADIGYEEDAYFHGETLAMRLKEYGMNLNFAPVGDLGDNAAAQGVKDRYTGMDAMVTAAITSKIVKGMQEHGVISAMKHFPGETGMAENIPTSYSELISENLLPFQNAIEQGMGMIMVSSLPVAAIDSSVPAMFSETVCEYLLREELGFEGVIITSKLSSDSVSANYSAGEAVMNAIDAGCDMMLLPTDYASAHHAVLQAVKNGSIPEERINQSVVRILALKIISGMIE